MFRALGFRDSLSNQTPSPNSAEIMALYKTPLSHEFSEKKCCYSSLKSCRCVCVCLHAGMCEISALLFAGIKNKTQVYSTFIKAFIDLASQNPQCCALK